MEQVWMALKVFVECEKLFGLLRTKGMNQWLDIHLAFGNKA